MSNAAYDLELTDAMQDLLEQVQVEHVPTEKDPETQQELGGKWQLAEWFQHYACLYIKYIDIYRKLEETYDQSLHPQKRIFLKPVLESTMLRLVQLKKDLVTFNNRPKSDLVHLDDLLVDLKYDPAVLEIPIPRYFRKADNIPVEMTFTEEIDKDKKKKKGKKGKKGGKKAKKAKEEKKEDSEDQKDKMTKEQRLQLLEKKLSEVQEMENQAIIDLTFFSSIRIIQKNERGRQYRHRILEIIEWKKTNDRTNEMAMRVAQGEDRSHVTTDEEREKLAAVYVQKQLRGILARKRVNEMRQEELIFLGMAPKPKTSPDEEDPIAKANRIKKERRKKQGEHWTEYETALDDMHEFIKRKEGPDIKEEQLNDRRKWIIEETEKNQNEPPQDIKEFYKRFEVEMPLSPEEEEAKKLKEEEEAKAAAAAKKKGEGKDKGKKGGKKKKKKGDDDDFDPLKNIVLTGPPQIIQKFQEMYENYADTWENKDESNNFEQNYDVDIVKEDVRPAVEKELEKEVDAMMAFELEHLKAELGMKKGKKKKGKKKKGKKKKGGKKKKQPPGMREASKHTPLQLLLHLEQNGIARRYPKAHIKDFIGEFNYLGSMLDNPREQMPDPSMAQIRQFVTEHAVFPQGSQLIKQRADLVKSMLFYGPPGTGKTMMVRSLCYETSSLLLDLSPHATMGKYTERKGEELLVASCFRVAQEYQPAIIYIDECELVFPTKKKGKKKGAKKKKGGANDPSRIKKAITTYKKTFMNKDMRIMIVGCTSNPAEASTAELKAFFDKRIYFPYPNYPTRLMMWNHFIKKHQGKFTPQFPISTLTHISEGYPAGSIEESCKQVLTKYRIENLETKPLEIQEFIGPLSLTDYTFVDEYKAFRDFTHVITGEKARIDAIEAKEKKGDDDGKDKKKKDKKKGKK